MCVYAFILVCVCYVRMYICMHAYVGVCMYTCMCSVCMGVYPCIYMYVCVTGLRVSVVACCNDSDSFVRFELGNERFRFVSVVDPIQRRFEIRISSYSED